MFVGGRPAELAADENGGAAEAMKITVIIIDTILCPSITHSSRCSFAPHCF